MSGFGFGGGFGQNNQQQQNTGFGGFGQQAASTTNTGMFTSSFSIQDIGSCTTDLETSRDEIEAHWNLLAP